MRRNRVKGEGTVYRETLRDKRERESHPGGSGGKKRRKNKRRKKKFFRELSGKNSLCLVGERRGGGEREFISISYYIEYECVDLSRRGVDQLAIFGICTNKISRRKGKRARRGVRSEVVFRQLGTARHGSRLTAHGRMQQRREKIVLGEEKNKYFSPIPSFTFTFTSAAAFSRRSLAAPARPRGRVAEMHSRRNVDLQR